jgi:hypothetical protein
MSLGPTPPGLPVGTCDGSSAAQCVKCTTEAGGQTVGEPTAVRLHVCTNL